jgi:beta-glucosidase
MGADQPNGTWFARGVAGAGLTMMAGNVKVGVGPADNAGGMLRSTPVDRNAQEDSRRFVWSGKSMMSIAAAGRLDLSRESNSALAIEIDVRADAVGRDDVLLSVDGAKGLNVSAPIRASKGWQTISVPLSCFANRGVDMTKVAIPVSLSAGAGTDIRISRIALGTSAVGLVRCDQ